MSRQKEKRIRKIRSKRIIRRIIATIIGEIFIFITSSVFIYFVLISKINDYIIESYTTLEQISEVIENNKTDKIELTAQLKNLKNYNSHIEEIIFADKTLDNFQRFDTGKNVKIDDFSKYLGEESVSEFEKNQIKRLSIKFGDYKDINFTKIFKTMSPLSFSENKTKLKWSSKLFLNCYQWVLYKTPSNQNICVKYNYQINNYSFSYLFILIIIFILFCLSVFCYKISKIISIISEKKNINKIIYTDVTTGGENKEYFINNAFKKINLRKHQYAIVQFRMDKYRNFCTAYGVLQGENLLEDINNYLEKEMHRREIVSHYENADFVMCLHFSKEEELVNRLKKFMEDLNTKRRYQHLLFSAGICKITSKNEDITNLITSAGLALSKNKQNNTNIAWFNESMREEQLWERFVEDDMEEAIKNHEFQLYLQPKFSTKKEVLAAAEALVRWVSPKKGFVNPGKFIPIFEKNGFIIKLDDYMLAEVAKVQANWMKEGKKLVPISVNVSRAHFTREDLAEHICRVVDLYNVPHEFIELEITESAFFDDKNILLKTVNRLKKLGFKVSMDDFGAGYSSLNSLKELPLDIIKLDAEFFRGADNLKRSNLIVSETISLAKKLGMEIVAEGIETREQVDFLATQNCDLIQGFYFSKPIPVTDFEKLAYKKPEK